MSETNAQGREATNLAARLYRERAAL